MSKVLITDYIEQPDIENGILGEQLTSELNSSVEVLLVWHHAIDLKYMAKLPKLKGIIRYGVGYDNIDLDAARYRNVVVCNTPEYGTEEVSDTAFAMIIGIARGIHRYDRDCRALRAGWQEHTLPGIHRISSQKLGVIGAGRIGGSVLLKAAACRFKTVFFDPYQPRGYEKMIGARRVDSVEELLEQSDLVSIHTPLTDETKNMVDERFVNEMKPGSSLINTARGKIVKDLDILYHALRSHHLNMVALDVLPDEPPKESALINAWRNCEEWLNGRLMINPHTAYYSQESFVEMRKKAAENAMRILQGKKPYNIVS